MSDRIRIQLQQGHNDIDSQTPLPISADAALAALAKLFQDNKGFKNDPKWEKEFAAAAKKATDWVKRVKQGGGLVLERGSGNVQRFKFIHDRLEYRIDIECHGAKDAGWFGG